MGRAPVAAGLVIRSLVVLTASAATVVELPTAFVSRFVAIVAAMVAVWMVAAVTVEPGVTVGVVRDVAVVVGVDEPVLVGVTVAVVVVVMLVVPVEVGVVEVFAVAPL